MDRQPFSPYHGTPSGTPSPTPYHGTPYPGTPSGTPYPGTPSTTPYPSTPSTTPYPGTPSSTSYPGTPYSYTDADTPPASHESQATRTYTTLQNVRGQPPELLANVGQYYGAATVPGAGDGVMPQSPMAYSPAQVVPQSPMAYVATDGMPQGAMAYVIDDSLYSLDVLTMPNKEVISLLELPSCPEKLIDTPLSINDFIPASPESPVFAYATNSYPSTPQDNALPAHAVPVKTPPLAQAPRTQQRSGGTGRAAVSSLGRGKTQKLPTPNSRQQSKKPKKYEISEPFEDPRQEKQRQNAINSKLNRDLKKQEQSILMTNLENARRERDKLVENLAKLKQREQLLKTELQKNGINFPCL